MREPQALIGTEELADSLRQPNLRIYDCTTYLEPTPLRRVPFSDERTANGGVPGPGVDMRRVVVEDEREQTAGVADDVGIGQGDGMVDVAVGVHQLGSLDKRTRAHPAVAIARAAVGDSRLELSGSRADSQQQRKRRHSRRHLWRRDSWRRRGR